MQQTASTSETHWVKPALPTTLGDLAWLPVPPTDVILDPINVAWVLPGPINFKKFKYALSLALRDYPHIAGRLSYNEQYKQWRIRLNNEGVPVTVGSTEHPGIYSPEFHHEPNPEFYDRIDQSALDRHELDPAPLMKIKLTNFTKTGETTIMISVNHITGDGQTVASMAMSLSNYYQGLRARFTPTYEKYLNPVPEVNQGLVRKGLPYLACLAVDHEPEEYQKKMDSMLSRTSRVDLKFSAEQFKAIATTVRHSQETPSSSIDALAAYIISIIQKVSDTPIEQILRIIESRGMEGVPGTTYQALSPTASGNTFITINCNEAIDPSTSSPSNIARILRDSMLEVRRPDIFEGILGLYSHIYDRSAKTRRFPWEWATENSVLVNNLRRVPVHEVHFGYPGRTRFYKWGAWEHFIEIFPAGPLKLPNGKWDAYEGGVDVSFALKHHIKPKFLHALRDDMKTMGFGEVGGRNACRL